MALGHQREDADPQSFRLGAGGRRGCASAFQDCAHPRHQFPWAERLGHIVVAAQFQAEDAVHLVVARRQEQNRKIAVAPDCLAKLQTVHLRQSDVQDCERRRFGSRRLQPLNSVACHDRSKARAFQRNA